MDENTNEGPLPSKMSKIYLGQWWEVILSKPPAAAIKKADPEILWLEAKQPPPSGWPQFCLCNQFYFVLQLNFKKVFSTFVVFSNHHLSSRCELWKSLSFLLSWSQCCKNFAICLAVEEEQQEKENTVVTVCKTHYYWSSLHSSDNGAVVLGSFPIIFV